MVQEWFLHYRTDGLCVEVVFNTGYAILSDQIL